MTGTVFRDTERAPGRVPEGETGPVFGGAIDRAFAVLEALAEHGPRASLGDVAAAARVPKPTAHRILHALMARGLARQEPDGTYAPGLRILALADRVAETLDVVALARPALDELHDAVGETVHLAVREGRSATYVAKLEGRRPYRMASRVGMPLELHATAIGKALLAFLPPSDAGALLGRGPFGRHTSRTLVTAAGLRRELARTRERGFAVDDEENEDGIRCVGAAILDHAGRPVAAVSISAPAAVLSCAAAERLGPDVRRAARTASLALGADPDRLPRSYEETR